MNTSRSQQGPASRTITPDLSRFDALTPSTTQFSQPLQPQTNYNLPQQSQPNYSIPAIQPLASTPLQPQTRYNAPSLQPQSSYHAPSQPQSQTQPFQSHQNPPPSVNWGAPAASNPWTTNNNSTQNPSLSSMGNLGNSMSTLSMNPRPGMNNSNSFSLPPPPGAPSSSFSPPPSSAFGQTKPPQKSGLDAFESLL
jgi:SCY1-like protein 2